MGKVFKALEKAGIDASVLGRAGQLRNPTEEEVEALQQIEPAPAVEVEDSNDSAEPMVVPPPPPKQPKPQSIKARPVPVPPTFSGPQGSP